MVNIINPSDVKNTTFEELSRLDGSILQNFKNVRFLMDGSSTWFSLGELEIVDGKTRRVPTSLKEVVDAYKNRQLRRSGFSYIWGSDVHDATNITIDPYSLTDTYVSDSIIPDGADAADYMYGLRRLLKVQPSSDANFKENRFMYVCVDGIWNFYDKNDIGYYQDGKFTPIKDLSRDEVAEIADKDLYLSDSYGNAHITGVINQSYSLTQVEHSGMPVVERISDDGSAITSYVLTDDGTNFRSYVSGNYVTTNTSSTSEFNEQSFSLNNNDARMQTTIYQTSQNGNYLRLKLQGQSEPIAVRVTGEQSQLYYADKSGNHGEQVRLDTEDRAQVLRRIIGQELFVKITSGAEEKWERTQAITAQQALFAYNTEKFMQSTKQHDNYMADNAYLRLSDGRYVKESEFVRPIAYNFVFDEKAEYDAYLCYVTNAEGKTETIIAPKDFTGGRIAGFNVRSEDMLRIKKTTSPLKESNVIQTTNNGEKLNRCVTLNERPEKGAITAAKKEKADELLQNALQQFKNEYQQGRYAIDGNKVLVKQEDGSYKEMGLDCSGELPKRFIYSDEIYTEDTTHSDSKYKYLLNNPEFVDEATGKLKNGPKFNTKAAIKDFYKKFGAFGLKVGATFFLGGGLLALLGAPVLVAGAAAAYVATGVLAPFYYLAKGIRLKFKSFADKVVANRNNIKKNLDNQLQSLYEKIMSRADTISKEKQRLEGLQSTLDSDLNSDHYADLPGVKEQDNIIEKLRESLPKDRWAILEEDYETYLEKQTYINKNILEKIIFVDGKKVSSKKNLTKEDFEKLATCLDISVDELKFNYLTSKGNLKTSEIFKKLQKLTTASKEVKKYQATLQQIVDAKSMRRQIVVDHLNNALQNCNGELEALKNNLEAALNGDIAAGIHSLSETRYLALFEIKNGYADVTEANAALYSKFNSDIKKVAGKLTKINSKVSKNPADASLIAEQKQLQANLYALINSPKAGAIYDELNERREYEQKIETLKTYLGVKYFDGTTTISMVDEQLKSGAYTLDATTMQYKLSRHSRNKKQDKIDEQKFNSHISRFNGQVYKADQTVEVDGFEYRCIKIGDNLYAKNSSGEFKQVVKDKDKTYTFKDIADNVDLEAHKMLSSTKITVIEESGHYEKPVVEEVAPAPKPDEVNPANEEEKRKKAEKNAERKAEYSKPISESTVQQNDLWKGIVAARQIDLAGENAAEEVAEFSKKLKFITSKKYAALLEKAAKSAPIEIEVKGKKQIVDIGLLSDTSEHITNIQNLVEKLKGKTK